MEFLGTSGDLSDLQPNYNNYTETNKYESASVLFSPGVLKGLYDMTKSFMDNLLPPNFLSEDLIAWDANGAPTLTTSYIDLVDQYKGLIIFLVFIILVCILVPISGLIFACLRCCGLCGAKVRASEKKKDLCMKIILGSLLIICWGVLLFATISAFAANSDMKGGINQLPENGKKVYSDSVEYIDGVKIHAHILLEDDYKEFSKVFKDTLKDSGQQTLDNLPLWNDIKVITNISTFVDNLSNIKTELTDLQGTITTLKTQVVSLKNGMASIKTNLKATIDKCGSPCSSMNQQVQDLDITMNVNNIPDVPNILDGLPIDDIKIAADAAKQRVENVTENIDKSLKLVLDNVDKEIDKAGTTISENLKTMDDLVGTVKTQMDSVYSSFKDGNNYLEEYYPYFYYVGIVLCCILLLVIVFIFFGLVFGAFGNRPDKYKNYCCSKGSGSVFLMSAVVVIFIITAIICIMTFIMSVSGLAADRVMCYPLRNPDKSSIIKIINKYVAENIKDNKDFSFNITDILQNCYNNQSIYQVLDVKSKFDIDETIKQFGIDEKIDAIVTEIDKDISNIFPSNFEFMNDDTKKLLEQLANIQITIDFSSLQDVLSQNVVNGNLDKLVQTLEDLAKITDQSVATSLLQNIDEINTYNTDILLPFVNEANNAIGKGEKLQNDLKMGSEDFPGAIRTFIDQIIAAQDNLITNNKEAITKAATQLADLIKSQIAGYTDRISDVVQNKLGPCGPLNVAIHAVLIAICDDIALPWNGFWASLFISLVTFVPILIISVWLASIYKSYKAEGQLFERDPKDRGKRKKQDDSNVYYNMPPRNPENPLSGMGYNDNNQNYYQASAPNDNRNSRYYDMAPKFNRHQEASTRF